MLAVPTAAEEVDLMQPGASATEGTPETPPPNLADTSPEDLFLMAFNQSHGVNPDTAHLAAFRDALSEI